MSARLTLRQTIDSLAVLLNGDASYVGNEIRISMPSHTAAVVAMHNAREALATMRSVENGEHRP